MQSKGAITFFKGNDLHFEFVRLMNGLVD